MSESTELKLILVGDKSVGRTKLLTTWHKGQILEADTRLFDTYRSFNSSHTVDGKTHLVSFWDTPTEDRVRLRALNYPETNCVLLLFAVDSKSSFHYITEPPQEDKDIGARALIQEIQDILTGVPIILVGSKIDQERAVSQAQAKELQNQIGAACYMEYSHQDYQSMQDILQEAVRLAVKHAETVKTENYISEPGGPHSQDNDQKKCCVIL